MQFIDTQRHKRKLIQNGYLYTYHMPLAQGASSWECARRRNGDCKTRIKLSAVDAFIESINEHSHPPSVAQCEVAKVKANIKRRAETTKKTTQQVLAGELAGVSEAAAANLPSLHHIRRTIRPQRQTNENLQLGFSAIADVEIIGTFIDHLDDIHVRVNVEQARA